MLKTSTTSKLPLACTARSIRTTSLQSSSDPATDTRPIFMSAAIGMGWQLAVVVLLPVIGGYKLDQYAGTTPLWTLVGLLIAMFGSILVIRRALAQFNTALPPVSQMPATDIADHKTSSILDDKKAGRT